MQPSHPSTSVKMGTGSLQPLSPLPPPLPSHSLGEEIGEDIRLDDACRYVDDFRLVVTADQYGEDDLDRVKNAVVEWLQGLLEDEAPGLEFAGEKTKVVKFGGERPLVFQSMKMSRIQSAVSGGFDAIGGEEILDSIAAPMQ